jgi:hypothetical protein
MTWRILRILAACGALLAIGAPACGGNSSETRASAGSPGSGGSGAHAGVSSGGSGTIGRAGGTNAGSVGTAGSDAEPTSVACGTATCGGIVLPFVNVAVAGCCADAKTSHCGLDATALSMFGANFSEACQPLAQPGSADESCPLSAKAPVQGTGLDIQLPGCCRPDHTCGYQLDKVGGLIQVGLGCVDATPFLDGGAPQSCGDDGAAGAGGDGGNAGAAGDSSALAGSAGTTDIGATGGTGG